MAAKRIFLVAFGLCLVSQAGTAAGQGDLRPCRQVRAEIVAVQVADGCLSPVGLCTAGSITGNLGLNGTTRFTAQSIAPGPATAPGGQATISYSGMLDIAAASGTLTATDTGIFNTESGTPTGGLFASFDSVDGGTGRYSGATGKLFIAGEIVDGRFISRVSGELCLR